ncbi:hypothetical protein FQN49_004952 [Arthroderma sp. PD_2]|nr:hypothetical protein FQN49_004952 [Arthroderma sp. PD_2]
MFRSQKGASRLLMLPLELRLEIYFFYFALVTIQLGDPRPVGVMAPSRFSINRNTLALIRTCRQIFHEVGGLFLGMILLSFDSLDNMAYHLTRLPFSPLSGIRHAELDSTPFVDPPFKRPDYSMACKVNLISCLQLDTLTIFGMAPCYDAIEGFVKFGEGWKELRFVIYSLKTREFRRIMTMATTGSEQPKHPVLTWKDMLLQRDGSESGASVSMYRSTQSWKHNSVLNPLTRELVSPTNPQEFIRKKEQDELLIVVKRGEGAHFKVQSEMAIGALQKVISERQNRKELGLRDAVACLADYDVVIAKARSTGH